MLTMPRESDEVSHQKAVSISYAGQQPVSHIGLRHGLNCWELCTRKRALDVHAPVAASPRLAVPVSPKVPLRVAHRLPTSFVTGPEFTR